MIKCTSISREHLLKITKIEFEATGKQITKPEVTQNN
jgi:hypothetical protein